jgi:hypothetical protein
MWLAFAATTFGDAAVAPSPRTQRRVRRRTRRFRRRNRRAVHGHARRRYNVQRRTLRR